ncbi:MAG: hypothetical protein ACR2PB_15265, partial [Desulfocapsaceae bacterium]
MPNSQYYCSMIFLRIALYRQFLSAAICILLLAQLIPSPLMAAEYFPAAEQNRAVQEMLEVING